MKSPKATVLVEAHFKAVPVIREPLSTGRAVLALDAWLLSEIDTSDATLEMFYQGSTDHVREHAYNMELRVVREELFRIRTMYQLDSYGALCRVRSGSHDRVRRALEACHVAANTASGDKLTGCQARAGVTISVQNKIAQLWARATKIEEIEN